MKSSEFINEGVGDWFARKGFLGQQAQTAALGAKLGQQRSQQSQIASDIQSKLNQEQFLRGLAQALNSAVQAGRVSVGRSRTGLKVDQFLKMYMDNLLKNYDLPPDFGPHMDKLYQEFKSKWKGGDLPDTATKIYNSVVSISAQRKKQSGGMDRGSAPAPTAEVTFNNAVTTAKAVYTFKNGVWTAWPPGTTAATAASATPIGQFDNTTPQWQLLNNEYAKV